MKYQERLRSTFETCAFTSVDKKCPPVLPSCRQSRSTAELFQPGGRTSSSFAADLKSRAATRFATGSPSLIHGGDSTILGLAARAPHCFGLNEWFVGVSVVVFMVHLIGAHTGPPKPCEHILAKDESDNWIHLVSVKCRQFLPLSSRIFVCFVTYPTLFMAASNHLLGPNARLLWTFAVRGLRGLGRIEPDQPAPRT